jgi:macrolide-specific efflux system membrane fusion protein
MKKKIIIILIVLGVAGAGWAAYYFYFKNDTAKKSEIKIVSPEIGKIELLISTTGSIQPRNRVEIKPTVNGRIDSILVEEGSRVKKGQTVAWMSSTDRAVLLDAAKSQGEAVIKHWEEVYKPTPLIAPIDGEVIVRNVEPGQSVTTATPVLVISDTLIVNARVDETDIGKVKVGQDAKISLDAYADVKERGTVDHISYESRVVSNVTTYDVQIIPRKIPSVFRSGMSADINIIQERKKDIMILPQDAIRKEGKELFVMVKKSEKDPPVKVTVEIGIKDMNNVEIVSGLKLEDKVVIESKKFVLSEKSKTTNPFMPATPAPRGSAKRGN